MATNIYAAKMEDLYGSTPNGDAAAYILPNGTLVPYDNTHGEMAHEILHDLEDSHDDDDGCADDPSVEDVGDCEDDRRAEDIGDFLVKSGAIRVSQFDVDHSLDVLAQPTAEQLDAIKTYFSDKDYPFAIEGPSRVTTPLKRALRMAR